MPKAAKSKPEKAPKKKKDPDAPRRPRAPYIFFCQENREKIKTDNPGIGFGEIGKMLGAQWSDMDESQKEPYVKMAEDDKKRYQSEMESYEGAADE